MSRRLSIALVVLAMCVSGAQASELFTKDKQNKLRPEPEAGMAAVYVMRPATMGAAIKTWSFWDENLIGVSKAKAYSVAMVPAGTRTIWSKAENTSAVEVEVEAGETYYFKQSIKPGLGKARVKMVAIDEAEAEKYFKKCGYAEPTDAGRARAAEIATNRLERAENKVAKKKAKKGK